MVRPHRSAGGIASDDYLSGMVRPCAPTTVEEVVTVALPPGHTASGLTYQLPAAAGVSMNYSSGVCNSFLGGSARQSGCTKQDG